jgi:hypothetical protein
MAILPWVLGGGALLGAYSDYKNKKYSDKQAHRGQKFLTRYNNLLQDPSLWEKMSTKEKRKFAADELRARKYGASPFAFGSKGKSGTIREMDKAYKNIKGQIAADKKAGVTSTSGGKLSQLPTMTKEQQKLQEKIGRKIEKDLTKAGLANTAIGRQILAQAMGNKNQSYNYGGPPGTRDLLNTRPNFRPEQVRDYDQVINDQLIQDLQAPRIREFKEQTLPEIKAAFAGRTGSGAYQRALSQASDNLMEQLARIGAEQRVKSVELGQNRSALDLQGANVGINRGNAQANLIGLGQKGYQLGQQQGQFEQQLGESQLDRALRVQQQDYANRQALLPYAFQPSFENLYMPNQGPATFGGQASWSNMRQAQPTNYFGNLTGAIGQGIGKGLGEGLGQGVANWFT